MDFTSDRLEDGRSFRTLNVIDIFTRRCLGIEVDTSLSSERVVRVMEQLTQKFGNPKLLQIDNGPEFRGKKLDPPIGYLGPRRTTSSCTSLIPASRRRTAISKASIESFNGRFREECLNQEWFSTLKEARLLIEKWRTEYNTIRPIPASTTYRPNFGQNNKLSPTNWTT